MSSFIVLSAKGTVRVSTIDGSDDVEAGLAKALKRAKGPVLIGSWNWQKMRLTLHGYKEGRAGTENKHELPTPFDTTVLFGDACVVATLEKGGSTLINLSAEHWKRFYNTKCGEDEGADEEEEEEEEEGEEEEEFEEEEGVEEEEAEGCLDLGEVVEEEEEEVPIQKAKVAGVLFKKIPKWMHVAELTPEPYLL